jgi:nucleoside-diphosphate-sugar epimerase
VEDVAGAIALAVTDERAAGRIYNVGERAALSMTEWVQAIGRSAGWSGEVVVVPQASLPPHLAESMNTRQHLVVDTHRIREELGYAERVPREEALARTIAWEREHPPEKIDPAQFDYAAEDAVLAGRPPHPRARLAIPPAGVHDSRPGR